ncbi:MAG: hypothetical protein ACRD38_00380 [Nitrososphaerales archaeon]
MESNEILMNKPTLYIIAVSTYLLVMLAAIIMAILGYIDLGNKAISELPFISYVFYTFAIGGVAGSALMLKRYQEGVFLALISLSALIGMFLFFSNVFFTIPVVVISSIMIVLVIKAWICIKWR